MERKIGDGFNVCRNSVTVKRIGAVGRYVVVTTTVDGSYKKKKKIGISNWSISYLGGEKEREKGIREQNR